MGEEVAARSTRERTRQLSVGGGLRTGRFVARSAPAAGNPDWEIVPRYRLM
jgi:hypothetical protein